MSNTKYIFEKLQAKQEVYLYEDVREVVVKIVPIGEFYVCYAKYKGKNEFMIDSTSKTVTDAELGGDIITEEEYEIF